jgi:hypothetical protein
MPAVDMSFERLKLPVDRTALIQRLVDEGWRKSYVLRESQSDGRTIRFVIMVHD